MNPTKMTIEQFAEVCRKLILKGWMPCGEIGQMLFCKDGHVYDLSASNLEMLDYIEKNELNIVAFRPETKHKMTQAELVEFKKDYDWNEAMGFAPFSMDDIVDVIAADEGENDGESWCAVVKLKDGFGYVDAWCDYTGWDCQSGGSGEKHESLEHLTRHMMTSKIRRRLKMEIPELDD